MSRSRSRSHSLRAAVFVGGVDQRTLGRHVALGPGPGLAGARYFAILCDIQILCDIMRYYAIIHNISKVRARVGL